MSKTLNYSLLLLKSSKKMQAKVFQKLDKEERAILLRKLGQVPYIPIEKLRRTKSRILSFAPALSSELGQQELAAKEHDQETIAAINYVVSSDIFPVQSEKEAEAYLNSLSESSCEIITSYLNKVHYDNSPC